MKKDPSPVITGYLVSPRFTLYSTLELTIKIKEPRLKPKLYAVG
jgi:hypothetical protein